MPDDIFIESDKETSNGPEDSTAIVMRRIYTRLRASPRAVLLIAMAAAAVIALIAYLLWPRPDMFTIAVETPPAVEGKQAGEDHDEHSQEGAIEVSDETAEMIGVKIEQVVTGEIEDTIATVGKALVAPKGQAIVGAKVDGRAVRVLAEPGQSVKAGQVLVRIDSPQVAELRGQLSEARSRLRLAEQNLARTAKSENRAAVIQAKNKLDFAGANLERKRRLAALGAAAGREVAEAEVEYKNAKAEYDYQSTILVTREQQQAASEVEQTRAVVARLGQSLAALGASEGGQGGTVSLASPITGTVIDTHVSIGQAVTMGTELMTVMNLASVIIEAQLPESQAVRVQRGQKMAARLPGLPEQVFEGQVESVGNAVNTEKRTVPVRARITNAGALLKHGMAVEVRLVTGVRKEGLIVPVSALVEDEGIKVVYVKEGDRYERRPVVVGTINYHLAEILSGIEEGEEVVVAAAYQLRNLAKGGGEEGGHHDDH
jgi:cobalt-zinc-cadmium efflux system membrane fusion protein